MKKKIVFICVALFLIFSTRPALDQVFNFSFNHFLKSKLKSDYSYDKIQRHEDSWSIYNLKVSKDNLFDFQTDKLEISVNFSFKRLKFLYHVKTSEPKLTVKQNTEFSGNKNSSEVTFDIKDLELNFLEDKKSFFVNFLKKPSSNTTRIEFFSTKNQTQPNLEISSVKTNITYVNFNFKNLAIGTYRRILKPFLKDLPFECNGILNGNLIVQKKESIEHFFSNLHLKKTKFIFNNEKILLDVPLAHLELDYPKTDLQNQTSIFEMLKNMRSKISFEALKIRSLDGSKTSYLSDLKGFFSYNPSIGPKWNIEGLSNINDISSVVKTEGKGFFNSTQINWIEAGIYFNEKCFANFKFKDDKNIFWESAIDIVQLTENELYLFQDLLTGFYPALGDVQLTKVNTSLKLNTRLNLEKTFEFDVSDLILRDLNIKLNQQVKQLLIKELNFKGSFNTALKESLTGIANIKDANIYLKDPRYIFKNTQAKLEFKEGFSLNSELQFGLNQIVTELKLNGSIDHLVVKGKIEGSFEGLIDFAPDEIVSLNNFKDRFFEGDFTFKRNDQSEIYGTLKTTGKNQELLQFGLFFQDSILNKPSHGWIKGANILLESFALDSYKLSGTASFTASFEEQELSFLVKGSNLKIEDDEYVFITPYLGDINSDSFISSECLQGRWNFKNTTFCCTVPINDCGIRLNKYKLDFSELNGVVNLDERRFNLQIDTAKSCNIDFRGNILFQSKEKSGLDLIIDTEKICGKIEDLHKFLTHFNNKLDDLKDFKGNFTSEKGFELQRRHLKDDSHIFWKFTALVDQAELNLFNLTELKEIKGSISLNSKGATKFENLTGKLASNNESASYDFYIPYLTKADHDLNFDFRILNPLRDIVRFCGKALINNQQAQINLDADLSHFFASQLKVNNFCVNKNQLAKFSIESEMNLKDFSSVLLFLKSTLQVPFLNKINLPNLAQLDGVCKYNFQYQKNKKFLIEILGNDLCVNRHKIKKANLIATLKDDFLDISHLGINDIDCSFLCRRLNDHIEFQNFSACLKDHFSLKMDFVLRDNLQMNGYFSDIELNAKALAYITKKELALLGKVNGKGRFSIDLPHATQELQIESDFSFQTSQLSYDNFLLENTKPSRAYFSYTDGWILDDLSFNIFSLDKKFSWLNCKIGKLAFQPSEKKYIYSDVHLFLPDNLFNKIEQQNNYFSKPAIKKIIEIGKQVCSNKEISIDGELDLNSPKCSFFIKEHQIDYKDNTFMFRNIKTTITPDEFNINSKYISEAFDFPLELKLYLNENMYGELFLNEDQGQTPLKFDFDFKQGFQLHSIIGKFHGMDAVFHHDKNNSFIGSLKCDFSKIKDFTENLVTEFFETLNMGKGYELQGVLSFNNDYNYQFDGSFGGKDIELGGCVYKTLMSDIKIISDSISISDLKVSDRAGIFKMNKLKIFNEDNKWSFSIPKFQMLEFRPSLLKKIAAKQGEIKPLVFREIVLQDFSGELEDKNTYQAHGYLSFINSFKRGHSLFDVPADFLGRIFGLDMELLIPVRGGAKMELKEGKFYFTNLDNAYSEGDRSKFFLADKAFPHTMNLNGDLNIHIQMKHYVLFTFTESFILSIEGNLSDPKFGLKKKKTLFSPK